MNKEVRKYLLHQGAILQEAIELIQTAGSRSVLIVNEINKAVGLISEGDILRAFINGASIHSPVSEYMNISFKYLFEPDDKKSLNLFSQGIDIIPILDNNYKVRSVLTVVDFLKSFVK